MPQPQKDVQKLEEINGETKNIAALKGLSYTSRDFLSLDHKREVKLIITTYGHVTGVKTKEGESGFMFVCGKTRCVGMKFRGAIFKPNVREKCLTDFLAENEFEKVATTVKDNLSISNLCVLVCNLHMRRYLQGVRLRCCTADMLRHTFSMPFLQSGR